MSKEAMKLALEALQYDADYDTSVTLQKAAIYALENAIADAEKQEPYADVVSHWHYWMAEADKYRFALQNLKEALANHIPDDTKMVSGVKDSLTTQQEQGEPVACDNCKKLEDELEPLRIKAELWKRDAIVWKSAYDVEVGFREKEQGEPVAWRNAAIRVGEDLCSVGPYGYYDMTAKQWLDWALSVVTMHLPPQQRTWVGLTDEERNDCLVNADPCECLATPEAQQLMIEVEAKLRSKNT